MDNTTRLNCLISVIVPFYNEEKHVKNCLDSILSEGYGKEDMEVLAVDGVSRDNTRQIIEKIIMDRKDAVIKILENPSRITPAGFNVGIKNARGRYILIMSAHASLTKGYISTCISKMEEVGADCAGGRVVIMSENFVEKAIALARSSIIGGSIMPHRYSREIQPVRTVPCGIYKKEGFDKIGLFDERLTNNQDEEFNWRMNKNGLKIYFIPKAEIFYHQKRGVVGLARQLFRYGFWKTRTIAKHPEFFKMSFCVPSLLVLIMALCFVCGIFYKSFFNAFLILIASYFLALFLFSAWVSLKKNVIYTGFLPLIYAVIHFSIGLGFLAGLLKNEKS
jgi:GT2 family glycosyltransferase